MEIEDDRFDDRLNSIAKIDEYSEMFNLPLAVKNILTDAMITDEEEIITMLEVYKFYTREQIITILNDYGVGDSYSFASLDNYQPDKAYSALEQKYSILVTSAGNHDVCIYLFGLSRVNMNQIELDFCDDNLTVYRLTPLNFNTQRDKTYVPHYDAMTMFKRILLEALDMGATDLHFDVKHVGIRPYYTAACRVGSDLQEITLFELNAALNKEIIGKLIEHKTSVASIDLNDAGGVTASAGNILGNDINVELRIGANRVKDGFHYVIRIQQEKTFSFELFNLGFHTNVLHDLEQIITKRSGITLITGAIRTGKNTTAFAVANEMLKTNIKMISYESPIEVLMPMTQVDYFGREDILLNAVRLAKKQDINVAFLNEIPNKEVAFAVLDLVNSSIHVITTMHMDRLWHLPYKLYEYYGESYKSVISQLNGVFNQKMFGISCSFCREDLFVSSIKNTVHRNFLSSAGLVSIPVSTGCPACNGTGFVVGGNQPYCEHLLFTAKLKDQLLRCHEVYEMEAVLRDTLMEQGHNMEIYMLEAIRNGNLDVNNLAYVI